MTNPAGESNDGALRLDFDRRVMLQFRGSVVTSDAGLLAYRELDDVLGLSTLASDVLADPRTGRNERNRKIAEFETAVRNVSEKSPPQHLTNKDDKLQSKIAAKRLRDVKRKREEEEGCGAYL